jgi:hypothetical protein
MIEMIRENNEKGVIEEREKGGKKEKIKYGILKERDREFDDNNGLMEKKEYLLREWI